MKEQGIVSLGNLYRMEQLMLRAEKGESLVIGFIGGSITQGSLASIPENCYAYRVYEWWRNQFPKSVFKYINAGIGGTTSQFGVARVEEDLLASQPDFVIVEFSVNDSANDFFMETYEGLIRKILCSKNLPAVFTLFNVQYNDGASAQVQHETIAKAYELPSFSIKSSVYQEILEGRINCADISPDNLHPNDKGHLLIAEGVCYTLEQIHDIIRTTECKTYQIPTQCITSNRYENSFRIQNSNRIQNFIKIQNSDISKSSDNHLNCDIVSINGFTNDMSIQKDITEFFKNGWTAYFEGDSICFEVNCYYIAIQYRKTINQPAPVAVAVIDGDEEHAVLLDGNFKETWGDCLYLETVMDVSERNRHTIEIRIKEAVDVKTPFYLVSLIVA